MSFKEIEYVCALNIAFIFLFMFLKYRTHFIKYCIYQKSSVSPEVSE